MLLRRSKASAQCYASHDQNESGSTRQNPPDLGDREIPEPRKTRTCTAALRTAATDTDPDLCRSALDMLVNFNDEFARQKLADGLRGIGEALVPQAAALGMLSRNDHNSATAIARDLLMGGADIATRAQAVRVIGSDPAATELLAEIMKNKSEFQEVRRASAVALKGLNPQAFQAGAIDILRDASDFKDIQSTVGGALERAGISLDPLKAP